MDPFGLFLGSTEALPPGLTSHRTIHIYTCVYTFMHGAPKKADRLCYLQSSFSRGIGFLKTLCEMPLIARVLFFLK